MARKLDQQKEEVQAESSSSGVAAARELFKNKSTRGQEKKSDSDSLWTQHENSITGLSVANRGDSVSRICTSGLDGRLVLWQLSSLSLDLASLSI